MLSPRDENSELLAAVGLNLVPGVGPRTCRVLRERYGSLAAAWAASAASLREVPRVGPQLAERIVACRATPQATHEIERCQQAGIDLRADFHAGYPRLLAETPDPPSVIYVRGSWMPCDTLAVALVGTRHATHYGLRQAERLAAALARCGLTVISGMARGIDAAAHRAAMAAGGRTIGVLAGSLLHVYPPEHAALAEQICQQGALLGEGPLECRPRRGSFPRRNRVISGLSLGVVVVEASLRSGALITARHALEQGREVFAVPGRVDQTNSRGCHRLLRDGAKLVETAADVLEELGPLVESTTDRDGSVVCHPSELQLNEQERAVLDAIDLDPTAVEQVIRQSRLPVARVLATLSVLEMRHLIRRLSGDRVVRAV